MTTANEKGGGQRRGDLRGGPVGGLRRAVRRERGVPLGASVPVELGANRLVRQREPGEGRGTDETLDDRVHDGRTGLGAGTGKKMSRSRPIPPDKGFSGGCVLTLRDGRPSSCATASWRSSHRRPAGVRALAPSEHPRAVPPGEITAPAVGPGAHLYAEVDAVDPALRVLCRVFGVTSISEVHEAPSDRAAIRDRLLELADGSFRARGSLCALDAPGCTRSRVRSWQRPGRGCHRTVRTNGTCRSTSRTPKWNCSSRSAGHAPTSTSTGFRTRWPSAGRRGTAVALVDGPRGALGAFLMMKRGCRVAMVTVPSGGVAGPGNPGPIRPRGQVTSASNDPGREQAC